MFKPMSYYFRITALLCLSIALSACNKRYLDSEICKIVKVDIYRLKFDRSLNLSFNSKLGKKSEEEKLNHLKGLSPKGYQLKLKAKYPQLQKIIFIPASIRYKYKLKYKPSQECFRCEDMEAFYKSLDKSEHVTDLSWRYFVGPILAVYPPVAKECL